MIGTVEFEAGGKQYTMRITTNAQVRYQRAAGETFMAGLEAIQKNPSDFDRLRRLIWASMSHVEGMTEDEAGDIMDEVGIGELTMKLSDAVAAAYPSSAPGNARGAKKAPIKK